MLIIGQYRLTTRKSIDQFCSKCQIEVQMIESLLINSGGSDGGQECALPRCQILFVFMQFSKKIDQSRRSFSGGSRITQRRAPIPKVAANLLFHNSSRKRHENEEFLVREDTSLASPRSATVSVPSLGLTLCSGESWIRN